MGPESETGSRSLRQLSGNGRRVRRPGRFPRGSDACHNCSVGLSLPAPCPGEITMSKRAFARVDPVAGLVAHSPEVLGMANCLDSSSQSPRPFGAYCFKLNFTPVSAIANAIAHPNDNEFGANPLHSRSKRHWTIHERQKWTWR